MKDFRQHTFLTLLWMFISLVIFISSIGAQKNFINNATFKTDFSKRKNTLHAIIEKHNNTDETFPINNKNQTRENSNIELEEELDEVQQSIFYSINYIQNISNLACLANYKEQYKLQFHPETILPPPKA